MTTTIENPNKTNNGKTIAGIILLIAGGLLLIDQFSLFTVPGWLFSWPMWMIAWGLYMSGKYNFKKPVWIVMIALGGVFLVTENIHHASHIIWPVAILGAGLYMVTKHGKQTPADYHDSDQKETV
jgi:hypothetical protein